MKHVTFAVEHITAIHLYSKGFFFTETSTIVQHSALSTSSHFNIVVYIPTDAAAVEAEEHRIKKS